MSSWLPNTDEIVTAYWRHYVLFHDDDAPDREEARQFWWAVSAVDALLERGTSDAVSLLSDLANAAPDGDALGFLGASAIEDFFKGPRPRPLDEFEARLRTDPKLRQAFNGIWLHSIPSDFAERFRKYYDEA